MISARILRIFTVLCTPDCSSALEAFSKLWIEEEERNADAAESSREGGEGGSR